MNYCESDCFWDSVSLSSSAKRHFYPNIEEWTLEGTVINSHSSICPLTTDIWVELVFQTVVGKYFACLFSLKDIWLLMAWYKDWYKHKIKKVYLSIFSKGLQSQTI